MFYTLLLILVFIPSLSFGQALDRTHVNYTNPLQYGATCDSTTLNGAITAIGSTKTTLFITRTDRAKVNCTWTLTADVTTNVNTTVYIPNGVVLSIASGKTVTFNGPIITDDPAGSFTGAGKYVFNKEHSVSFIDASIYPTLEAAVDAIGSSVRTLVIKSALTASATRVIPSTLTLSFGTEGKLNISAGFTVTYSSGCQDWPLTQHFSTNTTGVISLNPSGGAGTSGSLCNILYPEWWGANSNGTDTVAVKDANTLAFNRMFSAAPNSTADGTTPSPGRGATIQLAAGIYRTSGVINGVSYVTVQGHGWRNSGIIADDALLGNNAVIQCTDCRWSEWRDFFIETATNTANTNQHCIRFSRTGSYGNKVNLRNMAFVQCYDGINFAGDGTNISMAHMYIRNVGGHGLHFTSSGSQSGEFRNIFISNSTGRGIYVEGGLGKSVLENIVTELTGNDGIYLIGDDNVLNGIYIGDQSAAISGNGLVFRQVNNTVVNGLFIDGGANMQSRIVLDGSYDNQINGVNAGGQCLNYFVQWLNGAAVTADLLAGGNVIRGVTSGGDCANGLTNDSTYISFQGINRVREDIVGTAPITRPFNEGDIRFSKWAIRSQDRPAYAAQTESGYPRPDALERWAFYRERFAVNSPTEATGPSYGLYGGGVANFIGVEQSTEDAAATVITGDSSNFDGGTAGSWTVQSGATCAVSTTTEQAQSGTRSLLFSCTGGTGAGTTIGVARLVVTGLTVGKLYRLLWYQRRTTTSCTGCDQNYTIVQNSTETTTLAQGPRTKNMFTGSWHELGLYFQATDTEHHIRISMRDTATGTQAALYDTWRLQEIRSSGALTIGGGRKADTTAGLGGGSSLTVYGDDHATRPGEVRVNSRFGITPNCFTQATLPAAPTGTIACCSDCAAGTPCTGSGSYMIAIRNASSQWVCQ